MQKQFGATYVNRNEAFPPLICLDATKFVLLSFFSLIETIGPFIRGKIRRVLNKTRTVPFIRACLI